MSKVDDLFGQAKRLPVVDREQLATRLLYSLEPPYDEALALDADDEAELHRRVSKSTSTSPGMRLATRRSPSAWRRFFMRPFAN